MAPRAYPVVCRPVLGDDYSPGTPAAQLCCPCGDEYIHPGPPAVVESDTYCAWEGRGRVVAIPFTCEAHGHNFSLCLGHHKGNTFLFWALPGDGRVSLPADAPKSIFDAA